MFVPRSNERPCLPVDTRIVNCPFCQRIANNDDLAATSESSVALNDAYPVSEGHMVVVPRRHIERSEDLEPEEWSDLMELVRTVTREVAAIDGVDGVNVGFNSGHAAGQTVGHAYVHVIPRELGDVVDPRGGIRWVLPDTADYWTNG